MVFARFNNKQKIWLAIGMIVLVLILSFFIGQKLNDYKNGGFDEKTKTQADVKIKTLRTQKEIMASYKQNMERTIERLNEVAGREDIILISKNSFFDFSVPTDLMDMHLRKMLEVTELTEQSDLTKEALKEKVIAIINELLEANENSMGN